jgi:hypothetical protein
VSDGQCAGGKCYSEATAGVPNGACANASSCTVGSNAGCHGGTCFAGPSINLCRKPCIGSGLGSTGRCRTGFICYDPDSNTTNGNNYCISLCTADSECGGTGVGYGCNPWSKLCENKDKGLGRYGAACTSGAQCESGMCFTGSDFPNGYCTGNCRGDLLNCATQGYCDFNASYGDNWGLCYQSCTTSGTCRSADHYKCWVSGGASICTCLVSGSGCNVASDCCSGIDVGFTFCTCF